MDLDIKEFTDYTLRELKLAMIIRFKEEERRNFNGKNSNKIFTLLLFMTRTLRLCAILEYA